MDLSMYDDGIIHYTGGGKMARKLFKRLEAETGINFKKSKKKAEITISGDDPYGFHEFVGGAYTYTHPDGVYVYIDPEANKPWKRMALRHEIGHALGISEHSTDPNDAMSPGPINQSSWYSPNELQTFIDIWT